MDRTFGEVPETKYLRCDGIHCDLDAAYGGLPATETSLFETAPVNWMGQSLKLARLYGRDCAFSARSRNPSMLTVIS